MKPIKLIKECGENFVGTFCTITISRVSIYDAAIPNFHSANKTVFHLILMSFWPRTYDLHLPHQNKTMHSHTPYLLRALVKHLASARELVRVGCLPSKGGGVWRPCAWLLSGSRFGHIVGQAGAAGTWHGRRATGGAGH